MKSNFEWEKWGARDPLFAVATWQGKEKGAPSAWTDHEFYELGKSDWQDFQRQWQQYGMGTDHCVEIGCGAGRITKHLSLAFRRVTALDVSQHQLDYAKSRILSENISFVATDGVHLPLTDGSCDSAFSVHVFQHFEANEDAYELFEEIHRSLSDAGMLMVHLPIYVLPDSKVATLCKPIISMAKRASDFKASIDRRLLVMGKWRSIMRRLRFERAELVQRLGDIGFGKIEVRTFAVKSNQTYHDFVFATKGM
jgi:ubiquinone/menaquinone biosynthesis C-methylase UbiE